MLFIVSKMFIRSPTMLSMAYLLGLLFFNLSGSWAQVQLVETGGKLTYEGQNLTLTCTASGLRFKDFSFSWHWSPPGGTKEFVASITAGLGDKIQLKELGGGPYPRSLTLRLKCLTSGFQFKTSILGWYLWDPGLAPRWLSSLDHTSSKTNEHRIISSREDNSSQIFLQIKGLGLGDSGHYHCARRVGDGSDTDKLVFGPGTDVTVEPGPRAPLSPNVFLVRSQDTVACLVSDFYPKELHVSLASPKASVSAQALTVTPTAHGTYRAIQIGRIGENNSVTCSVQHLGKETLVSFQPDLAKLQPSHTDQEFTELMQRNKLLFIVLNLRLLFMKIVAICVLFTTIALIF